MDNMFSRIKNKLINKNKNKNKTNTIKHQISYNNIFNKLLHMVQQYNDKTKDITFAYECLLTNKIFFTTTKIDDNNSIIIQMLEINFLKPYKKNIFNTNKICVECGINHATHKYKNCNHYVNYVCALEAYEKDNSCKICSKNIVNNNKIILIENESVNTCSICLEDTNTIVHCGHFFHKECIEKLKDFSNKCPYCRCILYNNDLQIYNNVPFSLDKENSGHFNLVLKIY